MIELRGLHLGNIARSLAESVRPDLWPDWAVIPILGRTGRRLVVLDSGGWTLRSALGTSYWSENGYVATAGLGRLLEPIVQASNELTLSIAGIWDDLYTLPMCLTVGNAAVNNRFCGLSSTNDALVLFLYTSAYLEAPSPRPPTGQIVLSGTITGAARQLWRDGTIAATDTRSDEVDFAGPISVGVHVYARSPFAYANGGTTSVATVHWRKLAPPEIIDFHADPLLPFRRRQPVYYSVPSGGGAARSLIAALNGESATGTIAAIIARALTGDVTATSITGAVTASMARDLLASLQGQSTTGDIAATLQRLLLASLGGASTTGDVAATMSGLVSLVAAINGQSATGSVAATQARFLLADLQASSTSPDIAATLASLIELTASISGTTTTPAVAATIGRALAANLAGQSATGAITIEFAGMLLLVASIAGTSTTGALTATTGRELRAAIAAASGTGTVDGQLLRQIVATIAGASLTGAIAAELVNLVSLAASVVGVSVTPAVLAAISRDLSAEVAAGSTTGEASATVARTLAAAVEAGSLTPDDLLLILTGLGILHDTTIISRTPRRGISSRTVRRTLHSA